MQTFFFHVKKAAAIVHCSCALLVALKIDASAQNPTPVSAQSEMQKWIATTDAQWQAALNRDVTDVHAAELKNLAQHYTTSLEAAIRKASTAGDLDDVLALRNEQTRFAKSNVFPELDLDTEAASVKQIRAVIRTQLAKLEKDNSARTKALLAKYDQALEKAQVQLTQRGRIDDALLVKSKRNEVAVAWVSQIVPEAPESIALSKKVLKIPDEKSQTDKRGARMTEAALGFLEAALKKVASVSSSLEKKEVQRAVVTDARNAMFHAQFELSRGREEAHEDAKLTLNLAIEESRSSNPDLSRLRELLQKVIKQLKPQGPPGIQR